MRDYHEGQRLHYRFSLDSLGNCHLYASNAYYNLFKIKLYE